MCVSNCVSHSYGRFQINTLFLQDELETENEKLREKVQQCGAEGEDDNDQRQHVPENIGQPVNILPTENIGQPVNILPTETETVCITFYFTYIYSYIAIISICVYLQRGQINYVEIQAQIGCCTRNMYVSHD